MTALFIMPYFASKNYDTSNHLKEAIDSVLNQTDTDWRLLIIDDCSEERYHMEVLKNCSKNNPGKIEIISLDENVGPGECRNIGTQYAFRNNFDLIFFIDADDICHPERLLDCRKVFEENCDIDVVYSTFSVIDEHGAASDISTLCPTIIEILESHSEKAPDGINAWIEIGTRTGYANLTSATAVRTRLALMHPFPKERVSEDMHTWLRYSAGGTGFFYLPKILTYYRISSETSGSASRFREGVAAFFETKSRVDEDGFKLAVKYAIEAGKISKDLIPKLLVKFHIRLGMTLAKVGQCRLASEQLIKASLLIDSM